MQGYDLAKYLPYVLVGCYILFASYEQFIVTPRYENSTKGSLERHQLGVKLLTLLLLQVISSSAAVTLRIYTIQVEVLAGAHLSGATLFSSSMFIVAVTVSIYKLYDFLRDNDDNWFRRQWKKFKKWVKSLRFNLGGSPKFA